MKKVFKSVLITMMALAVCLSFTFTFSTQDVSAASTPAKVTGVSKEYVSDYEYKVTWKKASNAKKYQVYRATSKNGKYKRLITTSKTSYKVKVSPGKKYYFKIRGMNSSKKGSYSSKLLISTPVKPGKATNLKKSSYAGHYQYKLTWTKAKNGKEYDVYRATSKDGTYKKVDTVSSNSCLAYVIPGEQYYYKVKALNGVSVGDFSGSVLVKTAAENQLASDIPVYWNEEIKSSVSDFNRLSGDSQFIFFTDSHWDVNTKHSPAIINYLSKSQGIPLAVFGGDIIAGTHETTSAAIKEIKSFMGAFSGDVNLMCTTGNHDYDTSSGDIAPLTDKKLYELIYKQEKSFAKVSSYGRCAYTDDTENKVRYISLYYDAALDNETPQMGSNSSKSYPADYELEWLKNTVQDSQLDENWTVVLFTHGYYNFVKTGKTPTPTATGKKLGEYLLQLQGDEKTKADIGCWMVGHTHRDMSSTISDDNGSIRIICTNCDSYLDGSTSRGSGYWGGWTMTKGHDTEQVIEMVKIDTVNKKISLVRVGAGEDRSYSY